MAVYDDHWDDACINEDILADGHKMSETGSAREALTRIELDLAYCSEKILNLDNLLMHVASRLSDYEAPDVENGFISLDAIKKVFEFDMLFGILDSELKELDNFITSLQTEIRDAHQKIQQSEWFEISEMEEKLHDAEESLKQFQEQVSEIRTQSAKFERTLDFEGKETWNDGDEDFPKSSQHSSINGKWKMQTAEQQRHVLQMLEKSLARELDLEKKLSDSRYNEEEVKLKLHMLEREKYHIEEPVEAIHERLFETENNAEILMGISKELMSRLHIIQFNLNGALQREKEPRSQLQESMLKLSAEESALQDLKARSEVLDNSFVQQANSIKSSLKEAEDKFNIANSEALALREEVNSLEEKLRESNVHLLQATAAIGASKDQQNILHSEFTKMENVIKDLRENVLMAESRAESAEAQCTLLMKTKLELNEELNFIKTNGTKEENLLECKLKESIARLDYARASIEASEKQQGLFYATVSEKENLIEDLKTNFLKAERRAESAESKCTLLSETNLNLNKEQGYLKGRFEWLERSLHQADEAKIAIAKDIGIKTGVIKDLVMKLALERERLKIQISGLTKENKTLGEKLWQRNHSICTTSSHEIDDNEKEFGFADSFEESAIESSTNIQLEETSAMPNCRADMDAAVSMVDRTGEGTNLETSKSIEAWQVKSKYVLLATLVLVVSVCGMYIFQLENPPF